MPQAAVAVLLGVLALLQLPELPDRLWTQFLPILLLLAVFQRPWRLPALFAAGFLWALFRAGAVLSDALPPDLEGRDLQVTGVVASIPETLDQGVRFTLRAERLRYRGTDRPKPGRLRLSWYRSPPALRLGERWILTVRLKRPHGFSNPGGFDYEGWLFQQGIRATGYVRAAGENRRLDAAPGGTLDDLRQNLAQRVGSVLRGYPHAGVVKAITVGMRDDISQRQWNVLRATGTAHLMAISGLHIGLVAGFAFFVGRWLWSLTGYPVLHLPAATVGALSAIFAATLYAGLAGFSIPTQRALVMVLVFLAAVLLRRRTSPRNSLGLALLVVLILEPLAVLSAGFWLSFGAVAVILLGMSGRLTPSGLWWRWGRVHWLVAIGLFPLLVAFFGENPLLAPIANVVAVPVMGIVVVPLALAGALFTGLWPALGEFLLIAAAIGVERLWPFLEYLASTGLVHRTSPADSPWALLAAAFGVFLLLLPRGFPGRWLGLVWLGPLIFMPHPRPAQGEAWLTLLDVGQGLAAVVRTHEHVLVYDTGPRFSARFDAGRAVVEPFLRHQGVGRIDALVISHGDNDHAGGAFSLLERMPVVRLVTSVPGRWEKAELCRRGRGWDWDGVSFQILHPGDEGSRHDNNRSCVLRVVGRTASFLLPGDIEARVEREIVSRHGPNVTADVLVMPHHGSRTSSSRPFLQAVDPKLALVSVGYRNRFELPASDVVDRYLGRGIEVRETADDGAIHVRWLQGRLVSTGHRLQARRLWHTAPEH